MSYAIYLRKSRMDLEAEAHGEGDTLERHRKTLLSLAARQQLSIGRIYEEVVSGDTIAARPQMQAMLSDVEDGLWEGVLVMEVERLARGDTIDQGIVAQTFKFSDTRIITPLKSYDPNNEFDEEYFEFGLFMSRREYKTINRRLQRGRMASVKEGKWVGNRPPYGYRRVKLNGEKGFTLAPDPETAPVVRQIFNLYVNGYAEKDRTVRPGFAAICRRLNEAGIKSPGGKDWVPAGLRDVLRNPAYCGLVRWGHRPQRKTVKNNTVTLQRARLAYGNYEVYPGQHEPLVSLELFEAAQARIREYPSKPGPRQMEMKNPFTGLCYCALCGRAMARRPYRNSPTMLICAYPYCDTKGSQLDVVEDAALDALRDIIEALRVGADTVQGKSTIEEEMRLLKAGRKATEKELATISQQQSRLYDLLERGIYSEDVFLQRSAELGRRKAEAEAKLADIRQRQTALEQTDRNRKEIIPRIQHVLDVYRSCETAQEKNDLLKTVVQRIEYSKTKGGRWQESDLQLHVYPKLP